MRLCVPIWVSLAVVAQHRDEQYQLLLVRGPDPGKRRKSRSALSNFFMVRAFAPHDGEIQRCLMPPRADGRHNSS